MSFNRGDFLLNCIDSIELCASGHKLFIIDDNSSDYHTQSVLEELRSKYTILRNNNTSDTENKTGGLYGSMNMAMELAIKEGYDYAFFIQDDMQFVRRLSMQDIDRYTVYFSCVPNSIQLSTAFMRELSIDTFNKDYEVDKACFAYLRNPSTERGKSTFSAIGVFSVQRYRDLFRKFEIGEDVNSQKARSLGLICGRAIYPNICWLPYPRSFRGKRRSMKHRFFEYFGRSGFYPIRIMTEIEESRFLKREPGIPPVMERFLHSHHSPRHDIWSTGGGEYNFMCYGSIMAKLFKKAQSLKKRIRRCKV